MSASHLFKFGPNEESIAEYFFKKQGDFGNVSLVTNQRLIVTTKNHVETYPLTKINAVRIGFSRSLWTLILGIVTAAAALYFLAAIPIMAESLVASADSMDPQVARQVVSEVNLLVERGRLLQYVMIFLLALGGYLVYAGWKGSTALIISLQGGEKSYQVMGKDSALLEFVDTLTHRL